MSKIINTISNLITYLTILIVIIASIFVVPSLFGIKPFIVQSGSMEPVINTGGIAFVNTKDLDVEINDIITFKLLSESGKETVVTHRIIDIKDSLLYTKGDANENADLSPIDKSQVVGKFMLQVPYVGYLMAKMTPKRTIVAIVWLVVINFISIAMSSVFSGEEKEKGEEKVE